MFPLTRGSNRANILTLECAEDSPGELVKTWVLGSIPRVSDSEGPGWDQRTFLTVLRLLVL